MELNKNSKYNTWYLYFNNKLPNNFCDYFWGSAKGLLMSLFLLNIGVLFILILIAPITLLWYNSPKETFWDFCQHFGFLVYFGIIMGIFIFKILTYYENKRYKPYKESIVKTWYKDFKNKHCTLITWKDEK